MLLQGSVPSVLPGTGGALSIELSRVSGRKGYEMLNQVTTQYGVIRGVPTDYGCVFKGIPYAKPPVGPLRFRAPQEPEPFEGIFEADRFCPRFMQKDHHDLWTKEFYSDPEFLREDSEDALYLNIWTPARTPDEKLPVAFWIHGGAFLQGYNSEIEFDGEAFARSGVILVTINYRLGSFGFLYHPWLLEEGNGVAGNYGILDQIAALRWVRQNIAAFGGDPDQITIMGQSAGAIGVQSLMSSPLTEGMFARAILQSGGGHHSFAQLQLPAESIAASMKLVEMTGVRSLEELRSLPAKELLAKQNILHEAADRERARLGFAPVLDGYVFQNTCDGLIADGKLRDLPYMLGSTSEDLAAKHAEIDELSDSGASGRADSFNPLADRGILYNSCIDFAQAASRLGKRAPYVYYFSRQLLGDDAGAYHSAELWYMFGTLGRSWRPKNEQDWDLSRRMVAYWTNFIKTGDVNDNGVSGAAAGADQAASLPRWEPCSPAAGWHVQELR